MLNQIDDSFLDSLTREFAQYNREDLISKLAALQIYQPNQTQVIRLELAALIGVLTKESGKSVLNMNTLIKKLNKMILPSG